MSRIVTFYSYKGGVGRSMLLANVAWLAARWGRRVLCLDWDLEAPGLHHYLPPPTGRDRSDGILDLLLSASPDWRAITQDVRLDGAGRLSMIHAGRDDGGFLGRLRELDWERRIPEGLGNAIETWRTEWLEAYELVLVDCRTGVSDVGAIGAAQLPDLLVTVLNANDQGDRKSTRLNSSH